MQVETKTMGTIEVADEHIITIPSGLFGFEEYTDFALIDSEYAPLIWLQSRQDASLAFLLIDPFIICEDYEVDNVTTSVPNLINKVPSCIHLSVAKTNILTWR